MEYDGIIIQSYGSGLEFNMTEVHEIIGTVTIDGKDYLLASRDATEVSKDETV